MQELSRQGIAVSTSSACHAHHWQPSHVLKAMGYDDEQAKQAIRVSLGRLVRPMISIISWSDWRELSHLFAAAQSCKLTAKIKSCS